MKKQFAISILSALALAFAASPVWATTITATEFMGVGTDRTVYPNDVTPSGLMVGVSSNNATDKAVLWHDSATAPEVLLGAPGVPSGSSNAMSINGSGTIVGNQLYNTTSANYVPVVWNQNPDGSYGAAEALPVPSDLKNGHTEEINDSDVIVGSAAIIGQVGQVVGIYWQRNGTGWDVFELQRLSGAGICNANDINNLGVINGTCAATAVKWIPSGGSYGAPVALSGSSGSSIAINDGDVVVGAVSGNPAKWVGTQNPTLPFGKKFGGNSVDVNTDNWITAKKSNGSVLFYTNGTTTTNLSNVMAAQIANFTSAGFGGNLTDIEGGVVLVSTGALVNRGGGILRMVPVMITINLN